MKLWEYNKITGYWNFVRSVKAETADQWLSLFRQDNPLGIYMLSSKRPTKYPC